MRRRLRTEDCNHEKRSQVSEITILIYITLNRHKTSCQADCQAESADVHTAGTMCTDYSPRGLRNKENGRCFIMFLAWCGQRIELQEPVIIHENVTEFDTAWLLLMLGVLYHIESTLLSPETCGWPVRRQRRYTILRHKCKTRAFLCPWTLVLLDIMFSKLCTRVMELGV